MENLSLNNRRGTPVKRADLNSLSQAQLQEKLKELACRELEIDAEIAELRGQGVDTDLRPEMQALHEYNDMKDMAQVILGYLAAAENTTVAEEHVRFNLPSM